MVLEGVHLVPGMLEKPTGNAVVVHVVVAVEEETMHAQHFWTRHELSAGLRAQEKYLDRLGDIRRLQQLIVAAAGREGVPVLDSGNIESVTVTIIDQVFEQAAALPQTV
jgi:2-phosphoglycerate kinase